MNAIWLPEESIATQTSFPDKIHIIRTAPLALHLVLNPPSWISLGQRLNMAPGEHGVWNQY